MGQSIVMNLNSKILYGLERISNAFKALLREQAKAYGVSPLQIQVLFFLSSHKIELCSVSHLAREFDLTIPTISDAVRILIKKGYLIKDQSNKDSRRFNLLLSDEGDELVNQLAKYRLPMETALNDSSDAQLESLYSSITMVIDNLYQQGTIQVQRLCFGCQFYQAEDNGHYCNLLDKLLREADIRLDCAEFKEKAPLPSID